MAPSNGEVVGLVRVVGEPQGGTGVELVALGGTHVGLVATGIRFGELGKKSLLPG